ncbi:MAG TPA: hypothetical protein VGJ78_12020 [Vicinamibacterales bacterium]
MALTYSGVTTGATVDATSASPLASNVIGSSGAAIGGSLLAGVSAQAESAAASAPQPTGATGLARRLAPAIRGDELARAGSGSALAGATLSKTIACDSGSINISGTVSDSNGTGTVSIDYVDCRTGTDTINGPASLNIASYDQANGIVTDGTLTFTRVRFTGPGFNSDLTGTLRTQVSNDAAPWCNSGGCGIETLTLENFIVQDNTTLRMTRTDLVVRNAFESITAPTFFTESIDGRVCHDQRGCVDVTTSTAPFTDPWGPLYFSTRAQSVPDWGIINLAGATGQARITVLGIDLAKIQVDATGDGVFENTARLPWAQLGTAAGANLADTDGDGMHDSWETANGLNPNLNDAAGDADADGYSNLTEYLAGTNPGTNGSVPDPVRHLWVTDNRELAVVDPASGMINVFVGATDSGIQLNPVTRELGAAFSGVAEPGRSSSRTVTDAQGRTFTLAATASPTTWTLSSSTGTSITISSVAGTDPGSLIRYGDRGLAFRTVGASGPGYIYLVESRQLIP